MAAGEASSLDQVMAQRRLAVSKLLELDQKASKSFWPLYESYLSEMNREFQRLADSGYRLLEEQTPISESQADHYTEVLLETEAREAAINLAYRPRFRTILDAKKTSRLFLFEHRLRSYMATELANDMTPLK
jgi:hypothetical protein